MADGDGDSGMLPEAILAIVDRVRALGPEDRIDAIVEAVDVLEIEEREQLFAEIEALYGGEGEDEDEDEDEDDDDEKEESEDDGEDVVE